MNACKQGKQALEARVDILDALTHAACAQVDCFEDQVIFFFSFLLRRLDHSNSA